MKFHTDLEGSSFYSWGGGVNYKTKTLIVFPLMRFNRCLRWFAKVWSPYTGVRVKKGGLRFWVLGLRSSLYRHPLLNSFYGEYTIIVSDALVGLQCRL